MMMLMGFRASLWVALPCRADRSWLSIWDELSLAAVAEVLLVLESLLESDEAAWEW